ncbi:type VII secretion protein EccCb [Kibdelosporangium aridum]|uniref:DNA segregation ATPase FtsK/SpoIIIE, S-DNA-T family n=1 Tax=Kibdelosporangium aridum TaxID=2030 RepID=A0A1W2AL76_KIBAR|nr:type VII secretion protein EccCb [Kibdelosporangium aridum]SMC61201.1 DNA segregation ATPase FtsK/SpoIIIE, S-DNA-T family [Kibdelosporangium aridum]
MTGRRIALLVATTEHIDPNLRGHSVPPGDGRRLRELLLDPDVGGYDEVVLLANESKSGIERELERLLRDRAPEDTVLLHLTGCAVWNAYGQLFFATAGTDAMQPWSTALSAMVLGYMLAECQAKSKVVLLDCAIGAQPFLNDYLGTSAFLISATNRLTATVVRALDTGAADKDGDGQISASELHDFVTAELHDEGTQGCASQVEPNIVIAKARTQTTEPAEPAAPPQPVEPGGQPDLLDLLGISSPVTFDVQHAWRRRPENERYRVPIGVDESGQPVVVDIKNAGMDGMGPHGLCFGSLFDSGTTDFVRTFVLGLAAAHSSQILNFVIVDLDSGAAFQELANLPHVSALLTDLGDNLLLVDRLMDALAGEMNRRQELLRASGNFKNFWEYEQARDSGADLDPMPALVIVVNEFASLMTAKPALERVFVALGRLGKSLGLHMLLVAKAMDQGSLRALDPFLSYRIGLRMSSAEESRVVFGIPDAHELPADAGAAYLKKDVGTLVRFTTATVTGNVDDSPDAWPRFDLVVHRMLGQGPPAHEIWLPPLDGPCSLDVLMPPLHVTDRGLCPQNTPWLGQLQTPVGVVDKPFEQRRDLLWADFSGAAGHGAVVGAAGSGKSMLLRTLLVSMALTQTPLEAQFHCLDLGGGTLASVAELPHVGSVASAADRDLVPRIVTELASLVADRERRFREQGVDSMAEFRDRKRQGRITDDPFGDVFLVVDGWQVFRREFPALEGPVVNLVAQGLAYGVHVIVSAERWADIPPATKDLLGTRFELRVDDPAESEVDNRIAVNVPIGRPGFGLSQQKLHFVGGLPRIDGSASADDVDAGVQDALGKIRQHWRGPVPPLARPEPYTAKSRTIQIGVNDGQAPVSVDFDAEPHFLVFGAGESGKTNVLRTIVRGIMQQYTPEDAVIMLVDYRRSMLGYIDTQHLLAYAFSPSQLADMAADVIASLRKRLPGPDVTQEQAKDRSWWKGPELFLIVDDYELLTAQENNPLAPLREFVPLAKDVGLHVIVASRPMAPARASFDPVIGILKEFASPGVVLSVPEDQGPQMGNYRPTLLPPGRGTMITRGGQQGLQLTWTPDIQR